MSACHRPLRASQEIGQVKIVARISPCIGHMLLQPQQFWRLHFRGDNAANVVQHPMMQGVDALGLSNGTVIHPHNDVLFAAPGRADGQRFTFFVQHHQ